VTNRLRGGVEMQDNKERTPVKILSLIIMTVILSSISASACESYEECMKAAYHEEFIGYSKDLDGKRLKNTVIVPDSVEPRFLKAIAYKLDEISKYLKPKPSDLEMLCRENNKDISQKAINACIDDFNRRQRQQWK